MPLTYLSDGLSGIPKTTKKTRRLALSCRFSQTIHRRTFGNFRHFPGVTMDPLTLFSGWRFRLIGRQDSMDS